MCFICTLVSLSLNSPALESQFPLYYLNKIIDPLSYVTITSLVPSQRVSVKVLAVGRVFPGCYLFFLQVTSSCLPSTSGHARCHYICESLHFISVPDAEPVPSPLSTKQSEWAQAGVGAGRWHSRITTQNRRWSTPLCPHDYCLPLRILPYWCPLFLECLLSGGRDGRCAFHSCLSSPQNARTPSSLLMGLSVETPNLLPHSHPYSYTFHGNFFNPNKMNIVRSICI